MAACFSYLVYARCTDWAVDLISFAPSLEAGIEAGGVVVTVLLRHAGDDLIVVSVEGQILLGCRTRIKGKIAQLYLGDPRS